MDLHQIKYPLAIAKETEEIVNATEVPNGLNCNCYCHFCNEPLIAINSNGKKESNKQKDHFRHNVKTKCTANYETFIHWLSKYVIKSLDYIILPCIYLGDIQDGNLFYERKKILNKYNLNEHLVYFKNEKIQSERDLKITNCEVEKRYHTEIGDIIPDIVINHEQQKLFIEPYYTNPIDTYKRGKLLELDNTVISINLWPFVKDNNSIFTLEQFHDFIQNDTKNKKWEVIRKEKIKSLKTLYLKDLNIRLSNKSEEIREYLYLEDKRITAAKEIENHYIEVAKLEAIVSSINTQKRQLELDLGIMDRP